MTNVNLRGYRTVCINVLTLAVLIIGGLTGQITDPVVLRWMAIGLTVGNIILRFLTTGSVGSKLGGPS